MIVPVLIGLITTGVAIFFSVEDSDDTKNVEQWDKYGHFIPVLALGAAAGFAGIGTWVFYFGIPPIFTFGYRDIGQALPSDIPDGLPCVLQGLRSWMMRYLAGHRGDELGVLSEAEKSLMSDVKMWVIVSTIVVVTLPPFFRWSVKMERDTNARRSSGLREKWEGELCGRKVQVALGKDEKVHEGTLIHVLPLT